MEILLDSSSSPRAAADDRQAEDRRLRALANDWVNQDYKLLVVQAPRAAATAVAGQFFNLECPATERDKPYLRRPMSFYEADPHRGQLSFLYKVTGAGTRGLATLTPGSFLWALGPLGRGFALEPHWRSIALVGRGVGLATLAPLVDLAVANGVSATAILSARGRAQIMSVERFACAGAKVEVVLDEDGTSAPEEVETRLRDLHRHGLADALFLCGSNRLLRMMRRLGRELAIPGQVAIEQQMACGLGMCFCCVRNFEVGEDVVSRRVCWDGPVFDLAETLPW